MTTEALVATGAQSYDPKQGHGLAGTVKAWSRTVEVTAAIAANSTYDFGYVPSNARILGRSTAYWDDMANAGSPTMDLGLFGDNITDDDDALNDGLDLFTAASSASVIKDIANYGKKAWQFVNGQTTDPNENLLVRGTLKDAAVVAGGTFTVELLYVVP